LTPPTLSPVKGSSPVFFLMVVPRGSPPGARAAPGSSLTCFLFSFRLSQSVPPPLVRRSGGFFPQADCFFPSGWLTVMYYFPCCPLCRVRPRFLQLSSSLPPRTSGVRMVFFFRVVYGRCVGCVPPHAARPLRTSPKIVEFLIVTSDYGVQCTFFPPLLSSSSSPQSLIWWFLLRTRHPSGAALVSSLHFLRAFCTWTLRRSFASSAGVFFRVFSRILQAFSGLDSPSVTNPLLFFYCLFLQRFNVFPLFSDVESAPASFVPWDRSCLGAAVWWFVGASSARLVFPSIAGRTCPCQIPPLPPPLPIPTPASR